MLKDAFDVLIHSMEADVKAYCDLLVTIAFQKAGVDLPHSPRQIVNGWLTEPGQ